MRILLISFLFLLPHISLAAVTINEVAWMGTEASANDEWIELYNSGASIDLTDWVLSDGVNFSVTLEGTLRGGAYGVLERTDDESAPGTAFLVYTGALTNTGATLTLRRADGGIEDQVAGGENWEQIGGDNTTKETAQYTEGGWITAPGTPGKKNAALVAIEESVVEDSDRQSKTTITKTKSGASDNNTHISLERPDSKLKLHISGPTQGHVNQPITYFVEADGLAKGLLESLRYSWNLGNLDTGHGKEIEAVYDYPGEYVLVVEATYIDHVAYARHNVTILPRTLSIERDDQGNIFVHNNASYETDVSGYKLVGQESVVFPAMTFIAPRATLRVPAAEVEAAPYMMLALYDGAGEVAASYVPDQLRNEPDEPEDSNIAVLSLAPTASASQHQPDARGERIAPPSLISATSTSRGVSAIPAVALAAGVTADTNAIAGIPVDKLPYLGLVIVLALSVLGLYVRQSTKTPFNFK